jgi:DNA-binding GntR family transcriptional regulator
MGSRASHSPLLDDDQSLREGITESLRASLIAGDMRPGRVYSAPSLALEFGVSATPVREALLSLAKEGLVEAVRNKGFRVRELSDRELDDFTQIRALIEVPVMRSLAGSVAAEVLEGYRSLSQEIVDAAKRGSVVDYVLADNRFHLALLALAGNQSLVTVVRDLRRKSRLYGLPLLAERRQLESSAMEHHHLLDLLIKGDPGAVDDAMRRHLGHVRGLWAKPDAG